RAQPPAPVVATAAPRAAESAGWQLAAGAFYAMESLGAALPLAHGPGLILALGRRDELAADGADAGARHAEPRVGAWLAGGYQLPIEARQPDVGARLESLGTRIGVDARWWRLHLRVGAGANFTHVTPMSGTATANAVLAKQ